MPSVRGQVDAIVRGVVERRARQVGFQGSISSGTAFADLQLDDAAKRPLLGEVRLALAKEKLRLIKMSAEGVLGFVASRTVKEMSDVVYRHVGRRVRGAAAPAPSTRGRMGSRWPRAAERGRARTPDHPAAPKTARVKPFDHTRPGGSLGVQYKTLLQAASLVTTGLPAAAVATLQQTSGLTQERIQQVAGISKGSFARRKQTGRLSREESERLLRLGRLFERATAMYDGDQAGAREWLETPIPALGDRSPLDLAGTEPGAREVEDLIGRIEHGVVS